MGHCPRPCQGHTLNGYNMRNRKVNHLTHKDAGNIRDATRILTLMRLCGCSRRHQLIFFTSDRPKAFSGGCKCRNFSSTSLRRCRGMSSNPWLPHGCPMVTRLPHGPTQVADRWQIGGTADVSWLISGIAPVPLFG